ncbi:hypothetical protein BV25DRAFT_1921235 [Artomyces pyxidatus]|uniref:Uncharacterized protein n=1 Tax=Artomyces pyxidatus TaxID=48021 RepID=A0ACB8SI03_9AGAM|nr:hypothetical protein BV25DRAFT_1921235 [Artomyces pyxidatus]
MIWEHQGHQKIREGERILREKDGRYELARVEEYLGRDKNIAYYRLEHNDDLFHGLGFLEVPVHLAVVPLHRYRHSLWLYQSDDAFEDAIAAMKNPHAIYRSAISSSVAAIVRNLKISSQAEVRWAIRVQRREEEVVHTA